MKNDLLNKRMKDFYEKFLYSEIIGYPEDDLYVWEEMEDKSCVDVIRIIRYGDSERYSIFTESDMIGDRPLNDGDPDDYKTIKIIEGMFKEFKDHTKSYRNSFHIYIGEYLETSSDCDVRKWYDEYLVPKLLKMRQVTEL